MPLIFVHLNRVAVVEAHHVRAGTVASFFHDRDDVGKGVASDTAVLASVLRSPITAASALSRTRSLA